MFSAMRAPMATRMSRRWWRSTETSGSCSVSGLPSVARAAALRTSACANAFWNTGDSSTDRRIHKPTPTRTPESRNGIRQPQLPNASSDRTAVSRDSTPVASNRPAGAPVCGHDAQNPRRRASPCSETSSTAPPHSPPSAKPCTGRSAVSRTGAAAPTVAWVGSSPIAKVASRHPAPLPRLRRGLRGPPARRPGLRALRRPHRPQEATGAEPAADGRRNPCGCGV